MTESILLTIVKILFFALFAFMAITVITAFALKGRRLANTAWPYSFLEGLRFLRLGKYFDKRGWKVSKREIIGWIIVCLLGILGFILDRMVPP
jgi:hypothetical protein